MCTIRSLIPALAFADQDRMRGALNRERWTALAEAVADIADDLYRDAGAGRRFR